MNFLSKHFQEQRLAQTAVLLLLLLLLVIGGVPGYLTGKWLWKQPPSVANLKELRNIRKVGLNLPGWKTMEQAEQEIGEHKWSLQLIKQENSSTQALILLLPQNGPMNQPEIEWTDINGWGKIRWGKWDIDQYRDVKFIVKQLNNSQIEARFFRASSARQTFAVLQWYATPNGGNTSPWRWFAADQLAQWRQQRVPWVAVSILIPIEYLGEVEKSWSLAQSLGETIQTTLVAGPL
jgi:cyanoexosortase B-associated protein